MIPVGFLSIPAGILWNSWIPAGISGGMESIARTQHDSPKKNRLIGIVLGGQSVHQTGKMVGIPASSADRIWKKYMATGSTRNLPRSGHPRSVTDNAECLIVRTAMKERRLPFQEIANSIDLKISDATV